jgi:hypothetical protein
MPIEPCEELGLPVVGRIQFSGSVSLVGGGRDSRGRALLPSPHALDPARPRTLRPVDTGWTHHCNLWGGLHVWGSSRYFRDASASRVGAGGAGRRLEVWLSEVIAAQRIGS